VLCTLQIEEVVMKSKLYFLKVVARMAIFLTVVVLYVLIFSLLQDGFLTAHMLMVSVFVSISLVIQIVQFFTVNDIEVKYKSLIGLPDRLFYINDNIVDIAVTAIMSNQDDREWQEIVARVTTATLLNKYPEELIEITKELSRKDVSEGILDIFRSSLFVTTFYGDHNMFVQKVFYAEVIYPCATAMIGSTRDEREEILVAALDQAFLLVKYDNESIVLLAEIFARYLQEVIKEDVKNVLTDLCMKIMSAKPANLDMWTRFLREVKRELFPEEVKE
jgi:hypothetical protein